MYFLLGLGIGLMLPMAFRALIKTKKDEVIESSQGGQTEAQPEAKTQDQTQETIEMTSADTVSVKDQTESEQPKSSEESDDQEFQR